MLGLTTFFNNLFLSLFYSQTTQASSNINRLMTWIRSSTKTFRRRTASIALISPCWEPITHSTVIKARKSSAKMLRRHRPTTIWRCRLKSITVINIQCKVKWSRKIITIGSSSNTIYSRHRFYRQSVRLQPSTVHHRLVPRSITRTSSRNSSFSCRHRHPIQTACHRRKVSTVTTIKSNSSMNNRTPTKLCWARTATRTPLISSTCWTRPTTANRSNKITRFCASSCKTQLFNASIIWNRWHWSRFSVAWRSKATSSPSFVSPFSTPSKRSKRHAMRWKSHPTRNSGLNNKFNCGSRQQSSSSSLILSSTASWYSPKTGKCLRCWVTKTSFNARHRWESFMTHNCVCVHETNNWFSFRSAAYCMHSWRYGKRLMSMLHILITIYWRHRQPVRRHRTLQLFKACRKRHCGIKCWTMIAKLVTVIEDNKLMGMNSWIIIKLSKF